MGNLTILKNDGINPAAFALPPERQAVGNRLRRDKPLQIQYFLQGTGKEESSYGKNVEEEDKHLGKTQRGEAKMSRACRRVYVAFEEKHSHCQVNPRIYPWEDRRWYLEESDYYRINSYNPSL